MTAPAVTVRGATKWFGQTTALDRVDLDLGAGRVHGLVGPNGAGKSTLMAMLFGLSAPDEGEVRLFGRTQGEAGRGWLDGVAGFVEAPRFYPYLTGVENLRLLARLDGGGDPARPAAVLAEVGLDPVGRQKVRGYSLGMRQRLGLAAALLRSPRLLVLDEPANGLDPAGVGELLAALRRAADGGTTVLFSSHDMGQVTRLCDDVTILRAGCVAYAGTLAQLEERAPDPAWLVSTGDDALARRVAAGSAGVAVDPGPGLVLRAAVPALDAYVLRLAAHGVAVRRLVESRTPLEDLFLRLTAADATGAR